MTSVTLTFKSIQLKTAEHVTRNVCSLMLLFISQLKGTRFVAKPRRWRSSLCKVLRAVVNERESRACTTRVQMAGSFFVSFHGHSSHTAFVWSALSTSSWLNGIVLSNLNSLCHLLNAAYEIALIPINVFKSWETFSACLPSYSFTFFFTFFLFLFRGAC